ncbi:Uncharacterised protein [uncultured archaeon]|nr:Uncharacterised protein [uncultured archaeon]
MTAPTSDLSKSLSAECRRYASSDTSLAKHPSPLAILLDRSAGDELPGAIRAEEISGLRGARVSILAAEDEGYQKAGYSQAS